MLSIVETVEFVDTSLGSSTISGSVLLTKGQDSEDCVPFVTVYGDHDRFDNHLCKVTLDDDPSTFQPRVTFERADHDSQTLYIKCYVVEFDSSKVSVQSGSWYETSGGTTTVSATSSFDPSRTAMVHYWQTSADDSRGNSTLVRGRALSNGTQVDFYRDGSTGYVDGNYFLFEALNDEFSVQHISFEDTGNYWATTISGVDPLNTFVMGSFNPDTTSSYPYYYTFQIYQGLQAQLVVERRQAGGTVYGAAQAVTFNDPGYIHIANGTPLVKFASSDTSMNVTWSGSRTMNLEVDTDYSIPISSTPFGFARNETTSNSYIDSFWTGIELSDSTSVDLTRNSAPTDTFPVFYAIDWRGIEGGTGTVSGTLSSSDTFVKSVQNETFEVDGWMSAVQLNRGQDIDNCIVFSSAYCIDGSSSDHRENLAEVYLNDAGYCVARRQFPVLDNPDRYLKVDVSIVEFYPDQVRVQRGVDFADGTTITKSLDTTITGTERAFLVYSSANNSDPEQRAYNFLIRSRITSASGIDFYRYNDSDGAFEVAWFLAEDITGQNFYVSHYTEDATGDIHFYDESRAWDVDRTLVIGSNAYGDSSTYAYYWSVRFYNPGYIFKPAEAEVRTHDRNKYYSISAVHIERTNGVYVWNWNAEISAGNISTVENYSEEFAGHNDSLSFINTNQNSLSRHDSTSTATNEAYVSGRITDYSTRSVVIERDTDSNNIGPSFVLVDWLGYKNSASTTVTGTPSRGLIKSIEKFESNNLGVTSLNLTKNQNPQNCIPFMTQKVSAGGGDQVGAFFGAVHIPEGDVSKMVFYAPSELLTQPNDNVENRECIFYIIEFSDENVRCQHGAFRMEGTTEAVTLPTTVNQEKSWFVFGAQGDGWQNEWYTSLVTAHLSSDGTTLTFRRGGNTVNSNINGLTTSSLHVSWHLVECLDDSWTVKHSETYQNSGTTEMVEEESAARRRTIYLCSHTTDNSTNRPGYVTMRVRPERGANLVFDRQTGNGNITYTTMQAIEFNKKHDIRVFAEPLDFNAGDTISTSTISPDPSLNLDRSMVINFHQLGLSRQDGTTATYSTGAMNLLKLGNNSTISGTKYSVNDESYNFFQVVEWPNSNTHYFEGYTTELEVPVVRTVSAYRADTNELVDTTTSQSGTGYYRLETTYSGAHYLVCNDDAAGTDYNDLIYGKMYPEVM